MQINKMSHVIFFYLNCTLKYTHKGLNCKKDSGTVKGKKKFEEEGLKVTQQLSEKHLMNFFIP